MSNSTQRIDRDAWSACFVGEVENYDYHCAIESSDLEGFELGWYLALREGVLVCAVPVFFTSYDLATTASGLAQRVLHFVQPFVPGRLRLRLSCLGSPLTEHCPIGVHPSVAADEVDGVVTEILEFWAAHAFGRGFALLGIKDISQQDRERFGASLERFGLRPVSSLPTASLRIDFNDVASYLSRLSGPTRKDLRRKLKARDEVRVEFRDDPGPHLDQIISMYLETRGRSDFAFEKLSGAYFSEVLARMGAKARLALYFQKDELLAANLLLLDDRQLIDKYFVMRSEAGRKLNLYFLSWLANIEFCLERGLSSYLAGQGAAETKARLGSAMAFNWIYFKHRNRVVSGALGAVSGLLEMKERAHKGAH